MSFQVCADASVALKLVLGEPDSDQAEAIWMYWKDEGVEIIAPYHFVYETTSVIRNRVYRNDLSPEDGKTALEILQTQNIQFLHSPQIVERAWALAQRFNRPTLYDSYYLALSEFAGCEFWTADRRLYSVVTHALPWVKWFGDFRPAVQ
jgi:predicted nucleic acid-binding protein